MAKILNVKTRTHESMGEKPHKSRVYFFIEGENILEDLRNRWRRPYRFYKTMLPKVLAFLGLSEDTKASWSQKAGCTCGCSPGFVLEKNYGLDVFVTISNKVHRR